MSTATVEHLRSDYKLCARCGVGRSTKAGSASLCRDCKSVLTAPERLRWAS